MWVLYRVYITTIIYYLGLQWKILPLIHCPDESFLKEPALFVESPN